MDLAPHPVLTSASVFRDHAAFAWRALRRLGVPDSDVDDVCQEVFVVVHRKLAEFEGRSSVKTWLYGICVRSASDYRRRAPTRREVVTDSVPEAVVDETQHDALVKQQGLRVLDVLLDALDDDKRAVFVLYEIEQLGMAEVAEAVGCPLQTAYSRLHAARKIVEVGAKRMQKGERS